MSLSFILAFSILIYNGLVDRIPAPLTPAPGHGLKRRLGRLQGTRAAQVCRRLPPAGRSVLLQPSAVELTRTSFPPALLGGTHAGRTRSEVT